MPGRDDSDADAPEEFTSEQGILHNEEIRKVQKANKARVIRESKELCRLWAERKRSGKPKQDNLVQDANEAETNKGESHGTGDSEEEKAEAKPRPRKKKPKNWGIKTIILKDMSPPKCLQNSLEFLKKKKMQVSGSSSVLSNPDQALRLISTSGLLNKK